MLYLYENFHLSLFIINKYLLNISVFNILYSRKVKMKIKQFQNTVVSTWSPKSNYPVNIAMGTAAQQLDASFNTSSTLELYTVHHNAVVLDASISTDCR